MQQPSPLTPPRDTTASNQELQAEIESLRQQLGEARRMAALGELASTTTHEFNNVLTTILNYAKMGLRHTDEATRTRALEKIFAAGERAEKITNGVLGIARNRSLHPAPTNVAAIVSESLVLLEREMQKYRIEIVAKLETNRKAQAVAGQVQQVLLNLLTNARQALTDNGGRGGGRIEVGVAEDTAAGTVDLTVRDNGPGIAAEDLPKIFQSGYSTKSGPDATGKGGAGVGLAACRDIVQSHGGKLRVESTPGRGTAFIIKLPMVVESATPIAVRALGVPTSVSA